MLISSFLFTNINNLFLKNSEIILKSSIIKKKENTKRKKVLPDFSMKEPKGNNIDQLRKEVFDD